MKISALDGSNYFKGLLLLIRKDRKIDEAEMVLMERIGMTLGFEKEFCTRAIHDVLENRHIIDEPVVFSSKEIAFKFIKDGLSVALVNQVLHPAEDEWLQKIAEKNNIDLEWFNNERKLISMKQNIPDKLEVDDLTM